MPRRLALQAAMTGLAITLGLAAAHAVLFAIAMPPGRTDGHRWPLYSGSSPCSSAFPASPSMACLATVARASPLEYTVEPTLAIGPQPDRVSATASAAQPGNDRRRGRRDRGIHPCRLPSEPRRSYPESAGKTGPTAAMCGW